jgi:hypothetical protein
MSYHSSNSDSHLLRLDTQDPYLLIGPALKSSRR